MTTCTKLYKDIPFAHRQPNHEGHCRFIHGHDFSFEFVFAAQRKDECGFIVDFGKLEHLKDFLDLFDHSLVLNESDPLLQEPCFEKVIGITGNNLLKVPDCSAEGLAEYTLENSMKIIRRLTSCRADVVSVTCFEDSKNSATAVNHQLFLP